ncbi:uncharacterized protein [Dendrobates tinctorius]|uniref:uncharacterized protein n=1 Tax=Dendrobates tinctorius TaxID=92724 RepID=UPI003CC9BE1E
MGKPLSRPDCLRQNPACLGKGEEEDGYIEDCYVPQRSIYDTMRINEQIDQGCKLTQPSKSTIDRVEIATLSSNGTLGTSNASDAKAQEAKRLDERVIFDALKLSNDTLKSAPVPPRRRPNPERKENVNRRSWKAFIPPNFPDFAERMEASLSEVSEAGTSSHSLHDKTEFSQLLPDSARHSSCEQTESISSTPSQIRTPAPPPPAVSGNPSLEHRVDPRCQHVQSFDYYNDSEYEQDPLIAQETTTGLSTRSKPGHNFPSATWPRALKSFIKGSLSDGHQKAAELAYEECMIETLPLSPCLSDEVLDESLNVLIVPNLRQKTESELKFEEDELKILMEAEEEWEDIDSGGACHSVTLRDENMLPSKTEEEVASNDGFPDETSSISNLHSITSFLDAVVMPETIHWPDTREDYNCCSAVSAGRVTRRYQKLGSYSDSESESDSDQLFLELEQQCLTGAADEPHESVLETEVNDIPGNINKTAQDISKEPQLDTMQDHTYSKPFSIDSLTSNLSIPDHTDRACHGDKSSPVPGEIMPVQDTQQLPTLCKPIDTNTCLDPESDTFHLDKLVIIANTLISDTKTSAGSPQLPSLQEDEFLTPSTDEVLGLEVSSEESDILLSPSTPELDLEEVEETPTSIHVPHTKSYSPVCDMERDSCLGSSEQPDDSWTCEPSFQSTDIIPAHSSDEVSDGGEVTVSTTTHGCSSLPDDSMQSSTSASEMQELPEDSGGKIEEMAIKNILFELVVDNGITDTSHKSTSLQVINQTVILPQTSPGVDQLFDVTNKSSGGVTIFTCSEETNGCIDGETTTVNQADSVLKDLSAEFLLATNTWGSLSARTNTPNIEACASSLPSEYLEEQDSRIFCGLNSLFSETSTPHKSLTGDFTGSFSAQDLDFLTPGEIAEEYCDLASSEGNFIAVLQKVTLSCSEIDTSPDANVESSKSSETITDSSSVELNLRAKSTVLSSTNYCKDIVSLRQASEQCVSPEPFFAQGDSEFELASEGCDARVHLSVLSDSCSLSINTRDNSLAPGEEGGACDTSGLFDHEPTVLSSATEVTYTVL